MSNYYDLIKKGLSGAVNVAAGAVSKAAEVAKDLAEDLTSVKALKDYKLAGHVATAGPGSTWKIYNAISKKPGVCACTAAVAPLQPLPQCPPTGWCMSAETQAYSVPLTFTRGSVHGCHMSCSAYALHTSGVMHGTCLLAAAVQVLCFQRQLCGCWTRSS